MLLACTFSSKIVTRKGQCGIKVSKLIDNGANDEVLSVNGSHITKYSSSDFLISIKLFAPCRGVDVHGVTNNHTTLGIRSNMQTQAIIVIA